MTRRRSTKQWRAPRWLERDLWQELSESRREVLDLRACLEMLHAVLGVGLKPYAKDTWSRPRTWRIDELDEMHANQRQKQLESRK